MALADLQRVCKGQGEDIRSLQKALAAPQPARLPANRRGPVKHLAALLPRQARACSTQSPAALAQKHGLALCPSSFQACSSHPALMRRHRKEWLQPLSKLRMSWLLWQPQTAGQAMRPLDTPCQHLLLPACLISQKHIQARRTKTWWSRLYQIRSLKFPPQSRYRQQRGRRAGARAAQCMREPSHQASSEQQGASRSLTRRFTWQSQNALQKQRMLRRVHQAESDALPALPPSLQPLQKQQVPLKCRQRGQRLQMRVLLGGRKARSGIHMQRRFWQCHIKLLQPSARSVQAPIKNHLPRSLPAMMCCFIWLVADGLSQ